MAKKKSHRPQGHYCKICGEYKANEKFSGKGHAAHICKSCSKLSAAEKAERMTLNRLENMVGSNISKEQRKWLENSLHDHRPEVKDTAKMVYYSCFPYAERNARKKQLLINTLEFEVNTEIYTEYGEEEVHQIFTANRQTRLLTFHDCKADIPDQSVLLDGGRMAKLLRWAVHSLEIFMWQEDYCFEMDEDDIDPCFPDLDDDDFEDVEPEEPIIIAELDPSEITWRVQISYNNGEQQDIRCCDEYMPERVEELYYEMTGFFESDLKNQIMWQIKPISILYKSQISYITQGILYQISQPQEWRKMHIDWGFLFGVLQSLRMGQNLQNYVSTDFGSFPDKSNILIYVCNLRKNRIRKILQGENANIIQELLIINFILLFQLH